MSCGGRIYKGDSVAISIPFDVSGYTDLVVDYFTTGDTKIEKAEAELTIEDGFITAYFDGHDLDILPDGVVRYTINYEVDGSDGVESTNTMLYLATPAGYSAQTIDEIVDEAFESGRTIGYQDGFGEGVADTRRRMATTAITANGVYERTDGFNRVEVDVPLDTPCNIDEGKEINMANYFPYYQTTVVPESGYAGLSYVSINASGVYNQGVNDVKNQFVTLSATTNGLYLPQSEFAVFKEVLVDVACEPTDCSSAITEAFQSGFTDGRLSGMTEQAVADAARLTHLTATTNGTYTAPYGYSEVEVNVPSSGGSCNLEVGNEYQSNNIVTYHPSEGYDGFSAITIDATGVYFVGHTEGKNYQKSLLSALTLDASAAYNNTYSDGLNFSNREDGWSPVSVSVPLVYSFAIHFNDFPLSADIVTNIGMSAPYMFSVDEMYVTPGNRASLYVYGSKTDNTRLDSIAFDVPTSFYLQHSGFSVTSVNLNGHKMNNIGTQMTSAIRFKPDRIGVSQGNEYTRIYVVLYNYND